jgi:hypothetical protein
MQILRKINALQADVPLSLGGSSQKVLQVQHEYLKYTIMQHANL